jgi:hypothetical protein
MSVNTFKSTVWEARLIHNFKSVSIADLITTKPTKIEGSKIVFNRVGAGNVGDYSGTINWEEVATTPVEMPLAQKKYFAFSLDDVDSAQLSADVIDATTGEHAGLISEAIDAYTLNVAVAGVVAGNKIGSVATKKDVTIETAYDYIVDLGTLLGKAKAPKADRFVVVDNTYLNLLQKDDRFTKNPEVLANGIVENAKINGMTLVVSEEVGANRVVALHKSAVGYGKQIDSIEAMRLEGAFADGVRGLCLFDSVVLRPEAIAVLNYTVTV